MATEFKNLDNILKRLDGFAEVKKPTHADFYNSYTTASLIVDTCGGKSGEVVTPPV